MSDTRRRWRSIDPQSLSGDLARDIGSSMVEITLSPYDIPEGMRSFFDDKAWVIEFRYFSDHEPLADVPPRHGVSLKVGKKSGRLYCIRTENVNRPGDLQVFQRNIDRAIAALADDQEEWRLMQHFKVARKILENENSLEAAATG